MMERKIVAYGDSLTDSSYPDYLASLIHNYLAEIGNPFAVRVFSFGLRGALFAENEMGHKHIGVVLDAQPDVCIVLGGTNDLEKYPTPVPGKDIQNPIEPLYNGLVSLYERLRADKIEPVVVTVPSCVWPPGLEGLAVKEGDQKIQTAMEWIKSIPARKSEYRKRINHLLRTYAEREGLHYADLFTATSTPDGYLRSELADDMIHFNEEGYRVMATVIFDEAIRSIVERWKGELGPE